MTCRRIWRKLLGNFWNAYRCLGKLDLQWLVIEQDGSRYGWSPGRESQKEESVQKSIQKPQKDKQNRMDLMKRRKGRRKTRRKKTWRRRKGKEEEQKEEEEEEKVEEERKRMSRRIRKGRGGQGGSKEWMVLSYTSGRQTSKKGLPTSRTHSCALKWSSS